MSRPKALLQKTHGEGYTEKGRIDAAPTAESMMLASGSGRKTTLVGDRPSLGDQESVGCDAMRGVVVEASPSSPLKCVLAFWPRDQ